MPLTNQPPNANVLATIAADYPTAGEYVPSLDYANALVAAQASGTVTFSYFTAKTTETISTITAYTGTIGAAATPTICRMAVWSVGSDGTLTQVAVTPNDTTLFAGIQTVYPKAFSASFLKVAGQRYACSQVIVTGAALPTFAGQNFSLSTVSGALLLAAPTRCARLAGQSDMPAGPIAPGSLATSVARVLFKLS